MYKNRNRKVTGEYLLVNPGDNMRLGIQEGGVVLSNVSGDILLTTHPNREIISYLVKISIEPYRVRVDPAVLQENFTTSSTTIDDINKVIETAIERYERNKK